MSSISQLASQAKAIDGLANKHLIRANAKLDDAIQNTKENGLPPIEITPLQGQYLAIQCKLIGAKTVLEIGTLGGYSSIWFAEAGAKVTSLEISPKHREVALANTKGLDVDVILGPALDTLPKLAAEGRTFDLVFIDADWEQQAEYFDWAVRLTGPKGCIFVDNVVRELLESDAAKDGVESLVTKVGRDDRVMATLVPMLSSYKNLFDGFMIATKV